jgi:hypothetical protein
VKVEVILKRVSILKFRNPIVEYIRQRAKRGLTGAPSGIARRMHESGTCQFCVNAKANEQVCAAMSRDRKGKVKPISWWWICAACKTQLQNAATSAEGYTGPDRRSTWKECPAQK